MLPPSPTLLLASQAHRPKVAPFIVAPSALFTGIAWAGGGQMPLLTDLGFAWMTLCCLAFFISELWHLKERQGWGALVMYGGILVWFCHDYMTHWFWNGPWAMEHPEAMPTIAKMAFLYCLFVTLMVAGLGLSVPDRVVRWIQKYPEPPSLEFLFWLAVIGAACNLSYYALFANADFLTTMRAAYFGGRFGQVGLSAAFASNLTTSATAYFAFLGETISVAGPAGAAYAVLARHSPRGLRLVALVVWVHAMMLAYGGGTRGLVIAQGAPMMAFLVIRAFREPAFKKVAIALIVGFSVTVFGMLQFQSHFRMNLADANLKDTGRVTQIQGNTMFSEALDAYMEIPNRLPFFACNSEGEGALRAFPEMLYWFAIGPIPRPLWKDKPIDPAWAYRARTMDDSRAQNNFGTTVSYGLVGSWYFRFGILGMAEGALLMGWLYAATERMIRTLTIGHLQLMRLTLTLILLATLFAFFRDIVFFGIWRLIVLYTVIAFAIRYLLPKTSR